MYCRDNSTFPLTTLPYLIQTRFMECLPYFLQIELAQTNHQFLKIYDKHCRKRSIRSFVDIVVNKNGININDEFLSFKNEKSIKHYVQGNQFPTQFLTISKAENVEGVDIGIIAIKLIENGLYFQTKNQQKEVEKWLVRNLGESTKDLKKIEIGWDIVKKKSANIGETNEKYLMYLGYFQTTSKFANLSAYLKKKHV